MMQLRVSHYYGDVILHFTKSSGMNKPDRYLPMREGEFVALLSMADEINKQIKKTSKIAKKRDVIRMMKVTAISYKFPCHTRRKKGQTNVLHPVVILTILRVVMKKLLKVQAWEKGGVKKLKLVEKRKAKKMEKENDLVESSQGSDSQLSEAENK